MSVEINELYEQLGYQENTQNDYSEYYCFDSEQFDGIELCL